MHHPSDMPLRLREATALYQRRRFAEAQRCCESILKVHPNHAPTLRVLGLALSAQGHNEQAQLRLSRAIKSEPNAAAGHAGMGLVWQKMRRFAEAVASYDRAIALAPQSAETFSNRGCALLELDRAADALDSFDQAIAIDPRCVEALYNRGSALRRLGRYPQAVASYDAAIACRPGFVEAFTNRGNALRQLGRYPEALASFDEALAVRPDFAEAQFGRATTLLDLDRPTEALLGFDRAVSLRPDCADMHAARGAALRRLRRYPESLASYNQALALQAESPAILNGRGILLRDMHQTEQAIADHEASLQLNPGFADAHANLGMALVELGRLGKARSAFLKAVEFDPRNPRYYHYLAEYDSEAIDGAVFAGMEALARDMDALTSEGRLYLHFALGKAYADRHQHANSIAHFLAGCRMKRQALSYSPSEHTDEIRSICEAFTPDVVARFQGLGDPSDLPIFIVGMPRSGSTLIEQVLASHPQVDGAGEVAYFRESLGALGVWDRQSPSYPELARALDVTRLRWIGANYLARLNRASSNKGRMTDKMLDNFLYVGLIKLVFPNARIIHARRDPVDTCLSCFSKLFPHRRHAYTYDLCELAQYYRDYHDLMEHWQRILPAGGFLDVQYEDVVDDLEQQARRIVEFCGLPWDSACLRFHETQRPVRTYSMTQVRRPIYHDSVGRRGNHGEELQPLIRALGDLARV